MLVSKLEQDIVDGKVRKIKACYTNKLVKAIAICNPCYDGDLSYEESEAILNRLKTVVNVSLPGSRAIRKDTEPDG